MRSHISSRSSISVDHGDARCCAYWSSSVAGGDKDADQRHHGAGEQTKGRVVTDCTIEQGLGVRERMNLLAAVNNPATLMMLDSLGVAAGWRCLALGAGGGHLAMELARRVGPAGAVVGIDLDEELLQLARAEAAEQGLDNITFRVGDVEDFVETGLDLAYARMLLMHLRDPQRTINRMARALRPGGVVAVEDANFAACFTYPPCPAYDKWSNWSQQIVRARGGDPNLGPRLPSLLSDAGLTDVQVRLAQPAYLAGAHKQLQALSMAKQRTAALAPHQRTTFVRCSISYTGLPPQILTTASPSALRTARTPRTPHGGVLTVACPYPPPLGRPTRAAPDSALSSGGLTIAPRPARVARVASAAQSERQTNAPYRPRAWSPAAATYPARPGDIGARYRPVVESVSAAGAGEEGGHDVGGVTGERLAGPVVAHRRARVGVRGCLLYVAEWNLGVQGGGDEAVAQAVREIRFVIPARRARRFTVRSAV
jgi:2-polyprenyl-3-methyl-5-hydroxy-6-metoxy-1,4-benzoquinol methylase